MFFFQIKSLPLCRTGRQYELNERLMNDCLMMSRRKRKLCFSQEFFLKMLFFVRFPPLFRFEGAVEKLLTNVSRILVWLFGLADQCLELEKNEENLKIPLIKDSFATPRKFSWKLFSSSWGWGEKISTHGLLMHVSEMFFLHLTFLTSSFVCKNFWDIFWEI